jgi:DNA (cytosine-5)-methyltransferase 1
MTTINQNPIADERPIDLLVGGTPCQSFSVAGLRKGLADPRGNLMLTFLSIADKFKPKWVVWENVPGVLSSNGGKDFGTFLGALGELGYGFAYRVLDAQYFGVAQRRRRVFVVGYLGDWRVAAAVLFERESLQGNTKPSRKKRQEVASDAERSVGEAGRWWDGSQVAGTLTKQNANGAQRMPDKDNFGAILQPTIIDRAAFNQGENAQYEPRIEAGETMSSLVAKGPHAVAQPIAFKVRGGCEGGGKGYLGQEEQAFTISATQDQQIAQPIAYSFDALSSNSMKSSNPDSGCRVVDVAKTLDTTTPEPSKNQGGIAIAQPIAFQLSGDRDNPSVSVSDMAFCIPANPMSDRSQAVAQPIAVTITFNDANGTRADRPNGGLYVTEEPRCTSALTCGDNDTKVMQPIAVDWRTAQVDQGITQTLKTDLAKMSGPCIAVDTYNQTINEHTSQTIGSSASDSNHIGAVLHSMAIRRLTPKECERLQGFPDDWTKIPYRNKPADQCPDGPRYKACGNSMAVPVMRWIGERINLIESML